MPQPSRRRRRFRRALSALGAVLAVGCFPKDSSHQVVVVVEAPAGVVIRGQEMSLHARAYNVNGSDTTAVGNVAFQWISEASSLATIQDDGGGYATVTGVNSG